MDEKTVVAMASGMYAMVIARVLLFMGEQVAIPSDVAGKFYVQMLLWDFAELN